MFSSLVPPSQGPPQCEGGRGVFLEAVQIFERKKSVSYIDEIFTRTDIQHIREFLLRGVECIKVNPKGYKQRIDEAQKDTIDIIKKKFPEMDDYEEILDKVYCYVSEAEDVYMEIGLQCGAILVTHLLGLAK